MNFDLNELAATLAIGVFSLVGVAVVILILYGEKFSSIVVAISNISRYIIVVILALCYVFGMIVEDASNKFVDDDSWLSHILDSDDEIKAKVFFGNDYRHSIKDRTKAPLAFLASKYGLLAKYGGADGEALEKHIRMNNCEPNEEEDKPFENIAPNEETIKRVAKNFYYIAKSVAYRDNSYYNELKRIQMRIDFSRSLFAVSLILLAIIIATVFLILVLQPLTIVYIWWWVRVLRGLRKTDLESKPEIKKIISQAWAYLFRESKFEKSKLYKVGGRLTLNFVVLIVIFFLAKFAYSSEEMEFNKRAYGYYLSLKVDPVASKDNVIPDVCKEKPPVISRQ